MRTFNYGNVKMQKLPNFITIESSWDDNSCTLIHKKRHHRSYHNDIKYDMTLNTIFGVVFPTLLEVVVVNSELSHQIRHTNLFQWCTMPTFFLKKLGSLTTTECPCVRATSHTRLRAHDHYTSSTLVGGKGEPGPSSLHTMLEGPPEYVNAARWM
jgi:hypothetical protein